MFEGFTEQARCVLFFARYEAGQLGHASVESEALLLGWLREPAGVAGQLVAQPGISLETLRNALKDSARRRAGVSPPDENGLGIEARRIVQFAAQEADRLIHNNIDAEHLLLGILRDEGSAAASILNAHGLRLNEVRDRIVLLRADPLPGWLENKLGAAPRHGAMRPSHLPRTPGVHIAPTGKEPGEGGETGGDDFWALEGFDLKSVLSRTFSRDLTLFPETRIELPDSLDPEARYDFLLVLAPHETSEMRNRLMREGIERHFRVRISHESRPMDVYVLSAPDGQHSGIRAAPEFHGGGIGGHRLSFALPAFDGESPGDESFQRQFPTLESWRRAMSQSVMIGGISMSNGTVEDFCHILEPALDRPIVDETRLMGRYDIALEDEYSSNDEFIDRLRTRLGLHLTPARRDVTMLVVTPA
jgi:uncharacterized protein (TIGR03435 family)